MLLLPLAFENEPKTSCYDTVTGAVYTKKRAPE